MFKHYFILAVISAIVASLVGGLYTSYYYKFLFDFSIVLPIWKLVAVYFSISLIVAGLRFIFDFLIVKDGEIVFNIFLAALTIVSIIHPILTNGDFEMAEMYPGFAIPLYFIFSIIWLVLAPTVLKKPSK